MSQRFTVVGALYALPVAPGEREAEPLAGGLGAALAVVLTRLGCSVMQGYMFCRPVPPDDLEKWLATADLPRGESWTAVQAVAGGRGR